MSPIAVIRTAKKSRLLSKSKSNTPTLGCFLFLKNDIISLLLFFVVYVEAS